MNDLARWVAESDPIIIDKTMSCLDGKHVYTCFYCQAKFFHIVGHEPGCRYVLAREEQILELKEASDD